MQKKLQKLDQLQSRKDKHWDRVSSKVSPEVSLVPCLTELCFPRMGRSAVWPSTSPSWRWDQGRPSLPSRTWKLPKRARKPSCPSDIPDLRAPLRLKEETRIIHIIPLILSHSSHSLSFIDNVYVSRNPKRIRRKEMDQNNGTIAMLLLLILH